MDTIQLLPYSSFASQNLPKVCTCVSIDNEYIPVIYLRSGKVYKKEDKRLLMYDFLLPVETTYCYTKFNTAITHLLSSHYELEWAALRRIHVVREYRLAMGAVFDLRDVTPLVLLCIKRKYLFEVDKENPDPNHFCLLVANEFVTNEAHHHVYLNIKKGYIDVMAKHIDVVYTNNIKERCFNPIDLKPRFATVPEMMNHLKSINNNIKPRS